MPWNRSRPFSFIVWGRQDDDQTDTASFGVRTQLSSSELSLIIYSKYDDVERHARKWYLIYALKKRMAFLAPIFRKFSNTQQTLQQISYTQF